MQAGSLLFLIVHVLWFAFNLGAENVHSLYISCYEKEHPLKQTPSAQCMSTIVFSMAFLLLIKMSVPNLTRCVEKKNPTAESSGD